MVDLEKLGRDLAALVELPSVVLHLRELIRHASDDTVGSNIGSKKSAEDVVGESPLERGAHGEVPPEAPLQRARLRYLLILERQRLEPVARLRSVLAFNRIVVSWDIPLRSGHPILQTSLRLSVLRYFHRCNLLFLLKIHWHWQDGGRRQ